MGSLEGVPHKAPIYSWSVRGLREVTGHTAPVHLGWLIETIVGARSGHRESQGQAALEPGAMAEVGVVCGKSQGQAARGR